jgi:hypothetical protein
MPISYFLKQDFNLKWFLDHLETFVMVSGAMAPFLAMPFHKKASKQLKKADEEFGPTR